VLIPYAAAISALQLDSLKQIYLWLTWLAQVGKWGFLQDNSILLAIVGARGALINIGQQQTNASALYFQLTAFLILLSGCSYRGYKVSPKITLLCLTWFAVFALFFIWWEPQNIEFWVGLLAPVLILIGLAIESIPFTANWRKLAHVSILIMAILLGWNNWMATIQPNRYPESNAWLQKMRAVGECIGTDNTVFLNTGSLWAWLVYYDHIDVQVLDRIFLKSQRDAEDRVVSQSFDQVHSFIQEAYLHKRKVFWLSDTNDSTPLMRKYGVDQSTLEQLFGDYQKIPVACPYPLYEIRSH